MDAVITYVDGNDPVWKQDYERYTNIPVMEKRFRDWGTLKYLLRGIEVNMPFIRNVYLVVSTMSQVPDWVNQTELKIVLHKDIIPEEYLPTFNSTTIEMFLHKIAGLDNEFLYFNDDIFPVAPSSPEDFFYDGRPITGISKHLFAFGMYKGHVKKSDMVARAGLGLGKSLMFIRPQHACIPVLADECAKIFEIQKDVVLGSLTRVRTEGNMNMTLFISYMYHKGLAISRRQSCRHISLAATSVSHLAESILSPTRKLLCINDVKLSEEKFTAFKDVIIDSFEKCLPESSRFEI